MPNPRTVILVNTLKNLAIGELEAALALPPNALISGDVGPKIYQAELSRVVQAERGKLKLALEASLGIRVDLFNSASDQTEDATGVFGKAVVKEDYGIKPSPTLHANPTTGWLKYAFTASVRAEAAQALGVAAFSLDASRQIEYAAYRPQRMGDRIAAAMLNDLGSMPTALEVDDVASLTPGEAVSVRIPGEVNFSLDLDESVFASTSLKPLALGFGLAGPVNLAFSRAVTFSVDLSFQDDTRLVFVGMAGGWVHTSLRKAKTTNLGIDAGLGLKIALTPASQAMLTAELTEALFGAPEAALAHLTQALNFAQLSDAQKQLLKALGIKFGEGGVGDALLTSVKQKLADRRTKLVAAVTAILKSRLEVGFKFEYSRVATDGSLFEAELSPAAARSLHAALLRFDLRGAVALARTQDAGQIRNFYLLNERSVLRTSTLGFTLGFGKWLNISLRSSGKSQVVTQTNHNDEKRLAWICSREIAGAFNESAGSTKMTFRADTEEFRANPSMSDIKLALSMDSVQTGLRADDLPRLLDLAALWRTFMPERTPAQLAAVIAFLGNEERFDATLALRVSDRLVRAMVQWVVDHDNADFAPLLARSLPYWKGHEAREIEALRETAYTPVFQKYLKAEEWPKPRQRVRNELFANYPKLAAAERNNQNDSLTFVGYATQPDKIGRRPIGMRIDALRRACKQILDLPNRSAMEMKQVLELFYDKQQVFSDRSFTVRFFGALLAQIAVESGYDEGWNASLSLEFIPDGGERQSLIIGKSAL